MKEINDLEERIHITKYLIPCIVDINPTENAILENQIIIMQSLLKILNNERKDN